MYVSYYQPLFATLVLALIVEALWYYRRAKGRKPAALVVIAITMFFVSWPPLACVVVAALERPYPARELGRADAQAIVVLASTVYPPYPPLPTSRLGYDTYERCQYAAWLFKNWRPLPILASGEEGELDPRQAPPYTMPMSRALVREGVPEAMIWVESQSRSTHENAVHSARVLRSKGIEKIVLVTDAYHMRRAEKSFRKAGLQVIPAACAHRAFHIITLDRLLPGWEAIAWNEDSLHEIVGLLWYRLRGWI
ncbi:MAG: YdcF family protein [Acidobacteriia bacterium]|nr:YdcF family protein [Terriglobia bacterium]